MAESTTSQHPVFKPILWINIIDCSTARLPEKKKKSAFCLLCYFIFVFVSFSLRNTFFSFLWETLSVYYILKVSLCSSFTSFCLTIQNSFICNFLYSCHWAKPYNLMMMCKCWASQMSFLETVIKCVKSTEFTKLQAAAYVHFLLLEVGMGRNPLRSAGLAVMCTCTLPSYCSSSGHVSLSLL